MKKIKQFTILLLALCLCLSTAPEKKVKAKKKIKLNKTKLTLTVGNTYKLKLKNNRKKIKWSSSKKSIATVSSKGKVKAKKKGTATITAKTTQKKYKCKLTVKSKTPAPQSDNSKKDLDFTTPVTPDYQANYNRLKNEILTYGITNSDGNKVLNGSYTYNSMELDYAIVYNAAKQSFEFLLVAYTELDNDSTMTGLSLSISEASIANGSAVYHIIYESGYYGSASSTLPLANIRSKDNLLTWTVTGANIDGVDELANLFMNISYSFWQQILDEHLTNLSLTDLGFGS